MATASTSSSLTADCHPRCSAAPAGSQDESQTERQQAKGAGNRDMKAGERNTTTVSSQNVYGFCEV